MKKSCILLATLFLLFAASIRAQEAVVAPPEGLVVEGVPQIPVTLAETAGRYGAYRNAGMVDWHPARRAMLISTRLQRLRSFIS